MGKKSKRGRKNKTWILVKEIIIVLAGTMIIPLLIGFTTFVAAGGEMGIASETTRDLGKVWLSLFAISLVVYLTVSILNHDFEPFALPRKHLLLAGCGMPLVTMLLILYFGGQVLNRFFKGFVNWWESPVS